MLGLQDARDNLRHQATPDLDVLAADQGDVELVRRPAMLEQLAGAADSGVSAAKDQNAASRHDQRARRSAVRAANTPHIPWTPPPGGVAAEQR